MLPTIADYAPPTPADLPSNRVAWRIDPDRAVVLVHDMQRYFVDAFDPESKVATQMIEHICQIRTAAVGFGVPVYFTAQPPAQPAHERGLLTEFWGPGLQADGRDSIVEALEPVPAEDLITKWRYDAFLRTDLKERLTKAGRDQLIVTGVYAHIGCLMTATSAFMNDIRAFFVADATADFSADYHSMALKYAAERCAYVLSTDEVLAQLSGGTNR